MSGPLVLSSRESPTVKVVVDGIFKREVNPEDSFVPKCRELAREAGIKRFSVRVDGEDIEHQDDYPETFEGLDEVEIVKYDESA